MNTELLISIELAALATPLLFLCGTLLVHKDWKRKLLLFGQMAAFGFSVAALALAISQSPVERMVLWQGFLAVRFDQVTCGLIAAITFIAAVVTVFSERYLSGEKNRQKFLCGLSLLSSCSACLVANDNMILGFVFWHLLSWGLWWTMRLQEDAAANKSARTVLRHHLLSDTALFSAILIVFSSTGTLAFSQLPDVLPLLSRPFNFFGLVTPLTAGTVASVLLVLSFSVKSALFPFHRWLLATLDAPTPLSGILHAGVVNVSAILAWRTMPLLQETPVVLLGWGCLSALSAIVGTLSMSAQPDVKRKLVYSTVGQMGFMSLQCASGAIGAALFHLVAHGMFKCHMFLQSGSAVTEGLNKRKFNFAIAQPPQSEGKAKFFIVATALVCGASVYLLCANAGSLCVNAGWTAMSAIFTAAALSSTVPALNRIDMKSLCIFWSMTLAIVLISAAGINKFESLFHLQSATASATDGATNTSALLPVCLGLFAIIAIVLRQAHGSRFARALYVHSLNGFYAEEMSLSAVAHSSPNLRRKNEEY